MTRLPAVAAALGKSAPAPRRLLFALSAEDKEIFFPQGDPGLAAELEVIWIEAGQMEPQNWGALLEKINPEIIVTAWDTPPLPPGWAVRPNLHLRYVCHVTGGLNALVPRSLLERGVLVSNWGTAISHTIAEQAMLLVLAALRNLPLWGTMMELPSTRTTQLRTRALRGRRVGLHGFGGIAREIARMLQPFQVELAVYSDGVPKEFIAGHGVASCDSLEELFSRSEVLIECEALAARSRGSVTASMLALLPQDAVFVNVGRGAVVDEEALIARASEGSLRLALDVVAQEPLPPESPLRHLPNVLLSPHIAGPTSDTLSLCGAFALANIGRYLRGEPVEGQVTLEAYDRSI